MQLPGQILFRKFSNLTASFFAVSRKNGVGMTKWLFSFYAASWKCVRQNFPPPLMNRKKPVNIKIDCRLSPCPSFRSINVLLRQINTIIVLPDLETVSQCQKSPICHSERSEESNNNKMFTTKILRLTAQNDIATQSLHQTDSIYMSYFRCKKPSVHALKKLGFQAFFATNCM